MADIIKVKARKNYEWDQDHKSIRITISLTDHNSLKNVQIFLADFLLRITSKQKKTSHILDFSREIDYLSSENKFTMIDGNVIATLKKKNVGENWETLLVQDMSLADLKIRRKECEARFEANIKQSEEIKDQLRIQYDRMGTKQVMRFEEQQRKKLQAKKQKQKQEALNEVFRNVNETTGKIEYHEKEWNKRGEKALQDLERQEKKQREARQKQIKKSKQVKIYKQTKKVPDNSIFTEEDVENFDQMREKIQEQQEFEEIPVRKAGKVNVKFTEKMYPGVATRDYHYTEPPLPKGSVPLPPTQGDLENKNPLWLKDKGDRFMHDKNYQAALDAYNEALKIDPKHFKSLMNRSLAHMKLFNVQSVLSDCDSCLQHLQGQLVGSEEGKEEALLDIVKIKTRKALCMSWKGNFKESKQLLEQQISIQTLPSNIQQQLRSCLSSILNREESLKIKLKGDEFVKRNNHQQAIKYYNESILKDGNEYAMSNKCLCLNKLLHFKESIETADEGIKILNQFGIGIKAKPNQEDNNIYMKILFRKAKALENSNMVKEAEETIKKGLLINPEDKDFKEALKQIKSKSTLQQLHQYKQQASQLIKKDNPEQALKIYTKCIKLLENSDYTQEYLSILQNQCVCYLKLKQYDSIISVTLRILKLVNGLRNKIVEFREKKTTIDRQQLDKIAIRTLMRRANAYLKTGQVYNAKADLEKALEVDPNDQNVKKELEKLKDSI